MWTWRTTILTTKSSRGTKQPGIFRSRFLPLLSTTQKYIMRCNVSSSTVFVWSNNILCICGGKGCLNIHSAYCIHAAVPYYTATKYYNYSLLCQYHLKTNSNLHKSLRLLVVNILGCLVFLLPEIFLDNGWLSEVTSRWSLKLSYQRCVFSASAR